MDTFVLLKMVYQCALFFSGTTCRSSRTWWPMFDVDDFINALNVLLHAPCAGLAGGCPVCGAAATAGQQRFNALDTVMTECALVFSTKGDMTMAQRHIFIGIIFDTHQGRMYATIEKFAKLMALLKEVMELVTCSPWNMSKLRGKAQHQFRCLEGARPLLVGFNRLSAGPTARMLGIAKRRSCLICRKHWASCTSTYPSYRERALSCGRWTRRRSFFTGAEDWHTRTESSLW